MIAAAPPGEAMPPRRSVTPRFIDTEADVREGVRVLRRKCALMRRAHDLAGDPPLRRREPGFDGLARIIVGQQLSVASAAAIWGRLEQSVQPMNAVRLAASSDEELRAVGLSRPKIRTLRALSLAVADGGLDLVALEQASDQEVHEALCAVSGIGPWTADIFLMFCLGRADAFAAGDLALQIAAGMAADMDERPNANALAELAERWRPWRGVAARLLWAYYKVAKESRSGIPV